MLKFDQPRETGRKAIQDSVPENQWKSNQAFIEKMKEMVHSHPMASHPLLEQIDKVKLEKEDVTLIHMECAHAFAQVFTDSLVQAMVTSSQLEARLGPVAKVSSRFLLQLNILDELGFVAKQNDNDEYAGNPYNAHYLHFYETLRLLGKSPKDVEAFKPSDAAKKTRATFTDQYHDHMLLTCVLAVSEAIFTNIAGPWARSVANSTSIDTTEGYHAIHVEDEHGDSVDDEHSEDSWCIFSQAITEDRYEEAEAKIKEWLNTWSGLCDHIASMIK